MPSLILDGHYAGDFHWLIGAALSPVSTRDQMVRGQGIVDALMRERVLDPSKELLVIGAGAGGVSAAIRASQIHAVKTTLVEQSAAPFGLQAGSTRRIIGPHTYDWPERHWQASSHAGWFEKFELDYARDLRAATHARVWTRQLAAAVTAGKIDRLWGATAVEVTMPGSLPEYDITPSGGSTRRERFGAVILAYGLGTENVLWQPEPASKFTPHGQAPKSGVTECMGFPFWTDDPYADPGAGLAEGSTVVISGAGDGALQDFVRIATGAESARQLLEALRLQVEDFSWLTAFTDNAYRSWSVRLGSQDPVQSWRLLELMRRWLAANEPRLRLRARLTRLFAGRPKVWIVYPTTFPTPYYPLNLFCFALLEWGGKHEFRPLRKTWGLSHASGSAPFKSSDPPLKRAQDCWDQSWTVEIDLANIAAWTPASGETIDARGIVIRHGISTKALPKYARGLKLERMSMPYWPLDR